MTAVTLAFAPKDPAGTPQWRKVYALLVPGVLPVDGIITHEELCTALDLDFPADKLRAQAVFRAAAKRILADYDEAFDSVPGVGYRKVKPNEHTRIADGQRRKAVKSIRKGLAVVKHTKVAELTQAERNRRDFLVTVLTDHAETLTAHGKAINRVAAAQQRTQDQVDQTNARLDALTRALAARGIQVDVEFVTDVVDADPPFEPPAEPPQPVVRRLAPIPVDDPPINL